jgi:ABC-2 type transport system ATP-binding protein
MHCPILYREKQNQCEIMGHHEQVVTTENLVKNYGDLIAVQNVNLSVRKGSLFGLLGPNGSGKTTMIKILTGQIKPSSGKALVLGIDVIENPVEVRRLIGIVPEQESPPSFLTTMEYLEFIADIRKIPDIGIKSEWWFDFLEFGEKRNVLCKDLSRGTRQKLMLTQAFIHEPTLALIDEPLINFDPIMQSKVKSFFVSYVNKGNTLFFSTHLLETAEEICSEVAVLHNGRMLYTGTIDAVRQGGRHLPDFFLSLVRS